MPSIADIPTPPTMSKKRRKEDLDSPIRSSNTHLFYEPQIRTDDATARQYLPYSKKRAQDAGFKRQRIDLSPQSASYNEPYISRSRLSEMTYHPAETALEKQLAGTTMSKKESKTDLSSCHICHRKPTEKKQLDQYADCEGCGTRTCYICFRECKGLISSRKGDGEGGDVMVVKDVEDHGRGNGDGETGPWDGGGVGTHRRMICSCCCVEKGIEGEVWCLGCLRSGEGG